MVYKELQTKPLQNSKMKISIFLLFLPFISVAQGNLTNEHSVLSPTPSQILKIDTNNLKGIFYRNEKVFCFNSINDSIWLIAPDALPDGKYIAFFYSDTNKLAFEIRYKEHKKNGVEIAYYPNGKINRKQNYKNGVFDGVYICYFKNGRISLQRNYKNSRENGNDIGFCENGKKEYEGKYKDGLCYGISRKWDCYTGKLISKQKYRNGKLIKFHDYK